jgi:hypothetical protein
MVPPSTKVDLERAIASLGNVRYVPGMVDGRPATVRLYEASVAEPQAAIPSTSSDRPISFADACLIRSAEIHREARILTFDTNFRVYRWSRTKRFQTIE